MEEVARNLVTTIQETKEGTFKPQRENDKLTRALQNPKHAVQACGIRVVPWKVSSARDSTYKTHCKSKAEQEDKLHALQDDMNRKVEQIQARMDERVEQAVALALSKQQGAGAQADVVISLVSQRCSSYASTAATGDEPQENMPVVNIERYLVDYITMQTPFELHVKAKNITALVAYGSALPVILGGMIHGRSVPWLLHCHHGADCGSQRRK
jgi:hypothetical protein